MAKLDAHHTNREKKKRPGEPEPLLPSCRDQAA
jgi:hypothetical protein